MVTKNSIRFLVIIGLISLIGLIPAHRVRADAAPPQAPPGSSIESTEYQTNVQMMSEEVIIDIGYYTGEDVAIYQDQTIEDLLAQDSIPGHAILFNGDLSAHIEATFVMKNQGDEDEAFDVWFPTVVEDGGYRGYVHVVNFQAWTDGIPANIEQEVVQRTWATWPASFPAAEEVTIRVSYDTPPTYFGPLREFVYILETGEGWYGSIGEGDFIIRLPYEVTSESVTFSSTRLNRLEINPNDVSISDDEIRWHFTDLEPTKGGNVTLSMLDPDIWSEILSARSAAAANPDSLDAQLDLAHALENALLSHHSFLFPWNFAEEALTAYEQALELAPEDVELYVAYLDLMYSMYALDPLPDEFLTTLERALEIAPDDARLLEFMQWYQENQQYFAALTAQPSPTERASPTPSQTVPPSPTPESTPTFIPTDRPVPESLPESPERGSMSAIVILPLIGLLGIAIWLIIRRDRRTGR